MIYRPRITFQQLWAQPCEIISTFIVVIVLIYGFIEWRRDPAGFQAAFQNSMEHLFDFSICQGQQNLLCF